ncbi:MAG: histidine kinase, partial [Desulfovibrio sp.]|nr:histidine kinase [Desulfovibrio sp.]
MPPPSLPGVLLLCESEALGALDKRALREAGASEVRVMTSGVAAARMLAGITPDKSGFSPEIIVCTQKLEDMDGEQFCAILRLHPRLLAMPVLLILPNDSEAEQLKTLGSGASALLGRPYSVPALQQKLTALLAERPRLDQLRLAAQHTDTSAFDAALATYGVLLRPERQPEDYFRVGMRCLGENRWNHAISAFQRALRSAQIKGEAELGMAAAWKGKGDMPRFHAWLARAAETFVRARRWHRARTAYARLLQDDPAARSPFLAEAHRLIRENAYDEAAEALAQSLEVTPQAQDRFARICLTAQSPEAMLAALEAGLGKAMGESAGDALSQDIRESLNAFAKEREERQRQVAAERQRQLSRVMAARRGPSAEG